MKKLFTWKLEVLENRHAYISKEISTLVKSLDGLPKAKDMTKKQFIQTRKTIKEIGRLKDHLADIEEAIETKKALAE